MNPPRRWVLLCVIGAAVAAIHAALLLLWVPAWLDPDGPALAAPLHVRSLVLAPHRAEMAAQTEPPAAAPLSINSGDAPPRHAARTAPAPPAHAPAATAAPAVPVEGEAPPARSEPDEAIDLPVYATRLPVPGHWRYRLERGVAVGEAELQWETTADGRYEMRLEGRIVGVTVLDWASQGRIDAAGIAPGRFAVRRRGRDRQAANFQREAAKITFSGPSVELPLLPGAQDRLSWMLQLPAIVAAAPERFVRGASVVLFVAGARGGADVWTFVVQGVENVGEVAALKLVREPRRLYDTRVEIWLDPLGEYLPLRVLQTPSGGGAPLELLREQDQTGR